MKIICEAPANDAQFTASKLLSSSTDCKELLWKLAISGTDNGTEPANPRTGLEPLLTDACSSVTAEADSSLQSYDASSETVATVTAADPPISADSAGHLSDGGDSTPVTSTLTAVNEGKTNESPGDGLVEVPSPPTPPDSKQPNRRRKASNSKSNRKNGQGSRSRRSKATTSRLKRTNSRRRRSNPSVSPSSPTLALAKPVLNAVEDTIEQVLESVIEKFCHFGADDEDPADDATNSSYGHEVVDIVASVNEAQLAVLETGLEERLASASAAVADVNASGSGSNCTAQAVDSRRRRRGNKVPQQNGIQMLAVSGTTSFSSTIPPPPSRPTTDSQSTVKLKLFSDGAADCSVPKAASSARLSANDAPPAEQREVPEYVDLEENLYVYDKKSDKPSKSAKTMICECSLTEEQIASHEAGCRDDCLNRLLYIECGPYCPCGEYCSNRNFVKRCYAKVEPFFAGEKGWGLRSVDALSKNTFVIEYVGEVLSLHSFRSRVKQYARRNQRHHYFMSLTMREIIDATMKGNRSRFINHSCDPNCETQKWTVNGKLRIGFFTIRDVAAGEELTFDYQFQRYGKEAQTCYCGSANCRGVIGGESKMKFDVSTPKKERERRTEFEDMKLEQELEDLLSFGCLKNEDQVVTFARIMLRVEDIDYRLQLIDMLANSGERLLRLFVDLHGCHILWSWMVDEQPSTDGARWVELQLKLLNILKLLPIPHRNMLEDSRLLVTVQRWANGVKVDSNTNDSRSSKDDRATEGDAEPSVERTKEDLSMIAAFHAGRNDEDTVGCDDEATKDNGPPEGAEDMTKAHEVALKAQSLLEQWQNLKEDFKIPRKMNESTMEAPDGYSTVLQSISRDERRYNQMDSPKESIPVICREGRSPPPRKSSSKRKKFISVIFTGSESRSQLDGQPSANEMAGEGEFNDMVKRSKSERRRQFEEEQYRQEVEEFYKLQAQEFERDSMDFAAAAGGSAAVASYSSPAVACYNQLSFLSQPPPVIPSNAIQATVDMSAGVTAAATATVTTAPGSIAPAAAPPVVYPAVLVYDTNTAHYWWQDRTTGVLVYPAKPQQIGEISAGDLNSLPHFYQDTTTGFIHEVRVYYTTKLLSDCGNLFISGLEQLYVDQTVPPEEKADVLREEITSLKVKLAEKEAELLQLTRGRDDEDAGDCDETSSSAESDESDSESELSLPPQWRTAHDDEGNVYYYHAITKETQWDPPCETPADQDSTTTDSKTPSDRVKCVTWEDEVRNAKAEFNSLEIDSPYTTASVTTTAPADTSSEVSRKIKEKFKSRISSHVIRCLNPFRKADCKRGQITNNEDFKHLARKLTHAILEKELKNVYSMDELRVSDSVLRKARDYITRYMVKMGPVYKRIGETP